MDLTVGKLKKFLADLPDDMLVTISWKNDGDMYVPGLYDIWPELYNAYCEPLKKR